MKAIVLSVLCLALFSCGQKADPKAEKIEGKGAPMSAGSGIFIDSTKLAMKIDPICEMSVTKEVGDTVTYNGKLYGFCGTGCKEEFLKEPAKYSK